MDLSKIKAVIADNDVFKGIDIRKALEFNLHAILASRSTGVAAAAGAVQGAGTSGTAAGAEAAGSAVRVCRWWYTSH